MCIILLFHLLISLQIIKSHIFNISLQQGKLPLDWRSAYVTTVYKKGNKHDAANYRPISLTTVCCKILKHIIVWHIMYNLEEHKILSPLQHGFWSGHSCESQLIITTHDLIKNFDQKLQTDILILDFSKAFDTVLHKHLLHKLKHYGIIGPLHHWISSFLMQRTQQVVVEGDHSDTAKVESGIPQGTVLGPLMFLCFINDLPNSVTSTVRLFGNDCLLYKQIRSQKDQADLQKDLSSLENWAKTWEMQFNAKKCNILKISRSKKPHNHFYTLNDEILQQVTNSPYLGVILSDNMKFEDHISKITKKANSSLGFIRRNLKYCPQSLKQTAYTALVRSILEYSDIVWDPYHQKDMYIDRLETVQRRAIRFIFNDYGR